MLVLDMDGDLGMVDYNRQISSSTNGVLYIDLINPKDKQLVWQGRGSVI